MPRKAPNSFLVCILALICLLALPIARSDNSPSASSTSASAPHAAATPAAIPSKRCLRCHGDEEEKTVTRPDGNVVNIYVPPDVFKNSVHGKLPCNGCHSNVTELPHQEPVPIQVSCIQCHKETWVAQQSSKQPQYKQLGAVMQRIDSYMHSVHAQPSMRDQSKTNATCYDCHDAHSVAPHGSPARTAWRMQMPQVCGKCHAQEKADYLTSVHGMLSSQQADPKAAVCSDCHTSHDIADPGQDATMLLITQQCGNCHKEEAKTYMGTYHGQVNKLGYVYTAKCFDCHGSHRIQRVDDPAAKMHVNNRLETCKTCHEDATPGFLSFHPHGNTHDFERYPYMWLASKFMVGLLIVVFAFFWTHAALWFYREHHDRKAGGKHRAYVLVDKPQTGGKTHVRRFSALWRLAHLLLALAVMTLVLTGTAVLYADSFWAPKVMALLGGPQNAAQLHRIAALAFIVIFFGHLLYVAHYIYRNRKTFKWFGPHSLLPNLQDFRDVAAMFRWFFGKGPRPVFDRWTYWEKFDYWAPFWGMFIIGVSGAMLWFAADTAARLPGWVFNVATIVHGEEAFLAAVFLFSVHYFNAHFRPDKFPQDIVMFTGAVSLHEFREEHTLEYKRLVESGELEKHLVYAPSAEMTLASKILGAALIAAGLLLLILVLLGFFNTL